MLHSQYSRPSSPLQMLFLSSLFSVGLKRMQKLKHFQVHALVKPMRCPPKRRLLVFLLLTASRTAAVELHLFLFVHPRGNSLLEGAKTNRRP